MKTEEGTVCPEKNNNKTFQKCFICSSMNAMKTLTEEAKIQNTAKLKVEVDSLCKKSTRISGNTSAQ